MRRLVFSIVLGLGLVTVGGTGASAADPTPTATVSAKATPGKKVCKVKDPLLDEVSGLVATKSGGFIAVDDSTTDESKKKVFFLGSDCAIKGDPRSFPSNPLDTEDMIVSPKDGTVWIADTGDNAILKGDDPRPHVALWSMAANGKKAPVIHRVSYPDGDKHDAEALLMAPDGTPYLVTKEVSGPAFIYKPSGPLKADNKTPVPLTRVGEVAVPATETKSNAFAKTFNRVITGGAVNADGSKVVLRTYTDAFEWDVKGGDIVGALKGKPRTTGLPDEPFGEAIAYSADGKSFFTVSDMNGNKDDPNYIRSYEPATTVAAVSKKQSGGAASKSWYSDLDVSDITNAVAGVGLLGLILVGAGVFGIVRFRKQHPRGATVDDAPSGGIEKGEPATELIGVGSGGMPPRAAGGLGGGVGNGPVYGAKSGAPQRPQGGGPQYARPAAQPPQGPRGPQGPQQRPQGGGQQPRPPQQQPGRGPQQPQRGPQQPGRGGAGGGAGVYGGQQGGGQPRPPQGGQRPQGGGQQRPQGGGQPRPQGQGQPRPQGQGQPRPQGQGQQRPQGQGQPRPPQGGGQPQRQPGVYGGGRPPQGRDEGGYDRR
ncbi:hypothetical protein [Actinoplanes ianthinogenes]|nr:hypothetical protein [Actinoplanes ianthinogenes]